MHAALKLFEARRLGLLAHAWLLNEMRPSGAPALDFARPEDGEEASSEIGWQLVAMIVACLRHYVTGGGHGALGRRLVAVLHLQTGTNRDTAVSIWTWRTAAAVCELCAQRQLPRLIMCVAMRRQSLIHVHSSAWEEAILSDIEASYGAIVSSAEATSTLLNLQPLTFDARERYVYEVLKERHGFSGGRSGVPSVLLNMVSERAAGHPKHIEDVIQSYFDAGAIAISERASGAVVTTRGVEVLRRVMLPRKMRATLLQHFDALEGSLQTLLKVVSALDSGWSEGIIAALGLPQEVTSRAAHLLSLAVADGLVEEVPPVGLIAAADPGAKRAWRWTHMVMREQVLEQVLEVQRERVLRIFDELIEYHERIARRVERAQSAFRRMHSEHRSGWTTSTRTSISEASSASRLKDELAEVDLISDVAELRQRLKKALTASDGATARGASRLLRLRRRSGSSASGRFVTWLRAKVSAKTS